MSLPPDLSARLASTGLDPVAVESLILAALAEDLAGGVDTLVLDQAALDAREQRRQALLERLYYLVRKEAHELSQADSKQRYDQIIAETAQA